MYVHIPYYKTQSFIYVNTVETKSFLCPPFKEERVYRFANVGRYVSRSVGRSVDQMVSADYLQYHLSQSLHVSHVDWS